MEDLLGNSPAEMLHLFMDGELDSHLQTQLFSELAASDALRNEMSEMISIRSSVQNDAEAFAVPTESLGVICGRVGITPPIPLPLNPIAGGSGAAALFYRYWWAPVAALILAVIGGSYLFNDEIDSDANSDAVMNDYALVTSYSGSRNNEIQKADDSYYAKYTNPQIIEKTKIVYIERQSDKSNSNLSDKTSQFNDAFSPSSSESENPVHRYVNSSNPYFLNSGLMNPANSNVCFLPYPNSYGMSLDNKNIRISGGTKYALYLRGLTAKSYPETDLMMSSTPIFTNLSIGTYIARSNNVQFGIEFGQESYNQVYDNIENGISYQYMQNPIIFWGALGAIVRTNQLNFLGGAQPYAQFLLGGTQLGPIGKFITGIQLNSQEMGIGIILGFEGSALLYTNQKRWYSSHKFGFTFGTSIFF